MNHYCPFQPWPWPIAHMFIVKSCRVWLSGTIEGQVTKGAPEHAHKDKREFSEGHHWPFRQIMTLSHTRHTDLVSSRSSCRSINSAVSQFCNLCRVFFRVKTWRNHCCARGLLIPKTCQAPMGQHDSSVVRGLAMCRAPLALENVVFVGLCSRRQRNLMNVVGYFNSGIAIGTSATKQLL